MVCFFLNRKMYCFIPSFYTTREKVGNSFNQNFLLKKNETKVSNLFTEATNNTDF